MRSWKVEGFTDPTTNNINDYDDAPLRSILDGVVKIGLNNKEASASTDLPKAQLGLSVSLSVYSSNVQLDSVASTNCPQETHGHIQTVFTSQLFTSQGQNCLNRTERSPGLKPQPLPAVPGLCSIKTAEKVSSNPAAAKWATTSPAARRALALQFCGIDSADQLPVGQPAKPEAVGRITPPSLGKAIPAEFSAAEKERASDSKAHRPAAKS